MQLPEYGAEDLEMAAEEGGGEESVAADADVESAVAGFVETVRGVAVGGEDCDGVAEGLEGEGCVEDEAFGAADAEVGVEEYYAFGEGHGYWIFLGGCPSCPGGVL